MYIVLHMRDKQNFNLPSTCLRYCVVVSSTKKKYIFRLVLIIPRQITVRAASSNMIIKC